MSCPDAGTATGVRALFPLQTLIPASGLATLHRLRSPSRFPEGVRQSLSVALQISRKFINVPRQALTYCAWLRNTGS